MSEPGRARGGGDAHPLRILERWFAEARERGVADPTRVAFVTASAAGEPSARTVQLKRFEQESLLFTSTLYTRKARELAENPRVALLFHWPAAERQVHITGAAELAERSLARELFDERELVRRVQTIASRQGAPIDDLEQVRARHAHLMHTLEAPPECPEDWGAIRVTPASVELMTEAPDRIHERALWLREGDGWSRSLLSP
ncbi:MAG TPA: pyridoxal 5'-phosphate synthase [Solirubrobacteraceae bacterium]|nr:pyridoxal 5'-phosphate synthase [Solirubrobacteraceae bacterium]